MFAAKSQKIPEVFLTYLATYLSKTMDITHLCHLIAAFTQLLFPSPNIPAWYFFCKAFIMTAIHNTSPSSGFYFPDESVTTSSCYPSPTTTTTFSPHWPPHSQCIHSLPFVSAQSKQAATEGREGLCGWEQGIIERERMINEVRGRRSEGWLESLLYFVLLPSIFCWIEGKDGGWIWRYQYQQVGVIHFRPSVWIVFL